MVHTHFSLREISKTADRGGAGHPWARFPRCALTPLLGAINGKEVQKLPTTAALGPPACGFRARGPDGSRAGCWCLRCGAGARCWCRGAGAVVLVPALWCWCLRCGAGAVVLVLWCWCWCWCCGAGAGAGAVVLVLVLVPALWCWVLPAAWRAQFPCTRIGCIPHPAQGHRRTRAGRATYAARAGSQTTGCSRP